MKVLNLSKGTRIISLANNDVIIKPESISQEFGCSTKLFRTLTSTKNYQNVFRFIMDASERSMLDLVPCIPSLIISIQEAKDLLEFIREGGIPNQLDIHGNIIADKVMPQAKKLEDNPEQVNTQEAKEDPKPEVKDEPKPMTDEEIAKMAELHKVESDSEPEAEDEDAEEEESEEDVEAKSESTHTPSSSSSSSSSSHQKKRRHRK